MVRLGLQSGRRPLEEMQVLRRFFLQFSDFFCVSAIIWPAIAGIPARIMTRLCVCQQQTCIVGRKFRISRIIRPVSNYHCGRILIGFISLTRGRPAAACDLNSKTNGARFENHSRTLPAVNIIGPPDDEKEFSLIKQFSDRKEPQAAEAEIVAPPEGQC
jgi:hypothetical protein